MTDRVRKISAAFLVSAAIGLFFIYALLKLDYHWQWPVLLTTRYKFFMGFLVTLAISFFSLILSLLLGILAAAGRRSKPLFFRYLATVYVELIRGTPLLVQILVFFYIIGTAYQLTNRYVMGVLILSVFSGAYVSEIIRAGLESIPSAQIETARSLCFTRFQTYRYIIIPQLSRIVLPPLTGQFASLVKDSSLLSFIAVNEFTKNVMEADSLNFATFENYTVLAIGYLLITLPISWLTRRLERKMHYAD
ncbi:MAG: amino acid ABC transporter permease [Clostridia bacterium]|nr:amino acid ABC transporter permease [Eubacteriales bacterium]MDD3866265.1 amino acid ABC transporter permease [Eubacteriales bacterium]MDD4461845.1 amino acid ABC transporter permease [Eubacteriales bacterium]NCC48573.1 amino acid ABC transporter permease [Clostridia bacterium]